MEHIMSPSRPNSSLGWEISAILAELDGAALSSLRRYFLPRKHNPELTSGPKWREEFKREGRTKDLLLDYP